MILQALCDYYDRRKDELPGLYMANVKFSYAIVLDEYGNFKRLKSLVDDDGEGLPLSVYRP